MWLGLVQKRSRDRFRDTFKGHLWHEQAFCRVTDTFKAHLWLISESAGRQRTKQAQGRRQQAERARAEDKTGTNLRQAPTKKERGICLPRSFEILIKERSLVHPEPIRRAIYLQPIHTRSSGPRLRPKPAGSHNPSAPSAASTSIRPTSIRDRSASGRTKA